MWLCNHLHQRAKDDDDDDDDDDVLVNKRCQVICADRSNMSHVQKLIFVFSLHMEFPSKFTLYLITFLANGGPLKWSANINKCVLLLLSILGAEK